jgi:hypothetical protein
MIFLTVTGYQSSGNTAGHPKMPAKNQSSSGRQPSRQARHKNLLRVSKQNSPRTESSESKRVNVGTDSSISEITSNVQRQAARS